MFVFIYICVSDMRLGGDKCDLGLIS